MKFRFRFSLRTLLVAVTIFWPAYWYTWRATELQGVPQVKESQLSQLEDDLDGSPYWRIKSPAPFVVFADEWTVRRWHLWCFGYNVRLPYSTTFSIDERDEATMARAEAMWIIRSMHSRDRRKTP